MYTEVESHSQPSQSLSVVLLCYNDAETIGDCIQKAFEVLDPITSALQVIVVEDGSKDGSRKILEKLLEEYPNLQLVMHDHNRGYGPSLGEGIRAAKNQYVLCVDGDNQFDFRDAVQLLKLADGRYNIISGCRHPRADPWYRRLLGSLYNQVVHILFSLPVEDVDCGFKLLDRRSAECLFPLKSNIAAWVEAMLKAKRYKYRCANITIHHRPRQSGRSTVFNWSGITRIGWEILVLGIRSITKMPSEVTEEQQRTVRQD